MAYTSRLQRHKVWRSVCRHRRCTSRPRQCLRQILNTPYALQMLQIGGSAVRILSMPTITETEAVTRMVQRGDNASAALERVRRETDEDWSRQLDGVAAHIAQETTRDGILDEALRVMGVEQPTASS